MEVISEPLAFAERQLIAHHGGADFISSFGLAAAAKAGGKVNLAGPHLFSQYNQIRCWL
jgi:hypothetical protein